MEFREGTIVSIKEGSRIRYGELNGRPCMLNRCIGDIAMIMPNGSFASVRFPGVTNPHDNSDLFVFKTDELIPINPKDVYNDFVKDLGYCSEDGNTVKYHHMYKKTSGISNGNPAITKVLYNDPATIVFWDDGTKTIVKCGKHEEFDPEKGLAMAISKKAFGNKGNYYDEFKKWLPKTEGESAIEKAIKSMNTMDEDSGDVNNE